MTVRYVAHKVESEVRVRRLKPGPEVLDPMEKVGTNLRGVGRMGYDSIGFDAKGHILWLNIFGKL